MGSRLTHHPTLVLLTGALLWSAATYGAQPPPATEKSQPQQAPEQGTVQSQTEAQTGEKRKHIIQEAVTALNETRKALAALDAGKPKEALAALETVTGKLELIVAREPELGLAPVDVTVATYDLYAKPEAIDKTVDQAEDYLEKGEIQKARALLSSLASEVVISVAHIPLETYPDEVKAVAPLIDAGKIDEAKAALQTMLNTLVVVDHVIPLPVLRAEALLEKAEKLAQTEGRSPEQEKELSQLLQRARDQIALSEKLGYGDKKDYKTFYAQLEEIEAKTTGGKSGQGFFDAIKTSLGKFKRKLFE